MQFREQGRRVYLLRSVYDQDSKRCRQKLVGKIDRYSLPGETLPQELCEVLTEGEQREVLAWVAGKRAKEQASILNWEFRSAGEKLQRLAAVLSSEETPEITQVQAVEIHAGITAIQKALKRAGWPKNRTKDCG